MLENNQNINKFTKTNYHLGKSIEHVFFKFILLYQENIQI